MKKRDSGNENKTRLAGGYAFQGFLFQYLLKEGKRKRFQSVYCIDLLIPAKGGKYVLLVYSRRGASWITKRPLETPSYYKINAKLHHNTYLLYYFWALISNLILRLTDELQRNGTILQGLDMVLAIGRMKGCTALLIEELSTTHLMFNSTREAIPKDNKAF